MKKNRIYQSVLLGIMTLATFLSVGCTEEMMTEMTKNRISFTIDDNGFAGETSPTRGSKVTAITSFGVSASVYNTASTYTSAGCGSYFFDESATAGTPMGYYWPTSDYKLSFFGYYPKGNAAFTLQSTANTTGAPTYSYTVPSAIGSQVDVMTGQNVNVLGGGSAPVSITMKHRCAAICFSVTNSRSSAITLNSISIEGVKYTGILNEETWTLGSAVNSSSSNPFTLSYGSSIAASATANITGTTNIFLMLPQTIPAGAKIKVAIDGEDPLYADLTGSWIASKQYNYTLDIQNSTIIIVDEESEIENWTTTIDLSMVDNAGNDRESMTTANCYLVHATGKYKIPLVYGNAIKNGEDNRVAYYPGEDGSITNGTDRFVNHNGDGITGPWITKNGSGVDAGMGLTAASAELLWQDKIGLISAVSVDGDYLKFTVGTFAGGNAVIAVKDGSGTFLWSWHVWATDETLDNTTTIATGSHSYAVAPVNLGWVPTDGGGKKGYCTYYQWGRKDPFIPASAYNSTTIHTVYNISGSTVTGLTNQASTTATIADNIKNPTYHYYNSSTYGPCNTAYYNMWDAQNTATNNVTSATKKTIYDPCPPGFCVPTGNLSCYMGNGLSNPTSSTSRSDSNWDSTNKGKTWTLNGASIYFPAAGCRYYSSGSLGDVGSNGYYWSATPSSADGGRCLYVNSSRWLWYTPRRAYGFSVRPVAEE